MKSLKRFVLVLIFVVCCGFLFSQETSASENATRPKVGLVLAGGGAKGIAHLPVIKAIDELGIPIDFVAGTSIGAIVGGFYACGYDADEIFALINQVEWADFFMDNPTTPMEAVLSENSIDSNLFKIGFDNKFSLSMDSGFTNGERIYQFFKEKTIKYPSNIHFDNLKIPFRAVATNLLTGECELLEAGDIAEAIRASMSIPGIFTPAKIGEKYYMDGGVTDNLPIQAAVDYGCDIIIAVEISDDLETEIRAFDSNYFVAVAQMYYMTQAPQNKPKYPLADFVFFPEIGNYSYLSFKDSQAIWDLSEKSLQPYLVELEKIRDRVFAGNYDIQKETSKIEYEDKDWISLSSIQVESPNPKDKKYVETLFAKIAEKPLTDLDYRNFVTEIYETGRYESVNTRINVYDNANVLVVSLAPVATSYFDVLLSGSYHGVLSAKETTKLVLTTDFQYRGLTGVNSVLSLKMGVVNGFFANAMYIQPIGAKSFTKVNGKYISDRKFITSNIQDLSPEATSLSGFVGSVGFGYRGSLNRLLYLGVDYSFYNSYGYSSENLNLSRKENPKSEEKSGITFNVKYSINNLNLPDFPNRGIRLTLENTFLVPFGGNNVPQFCNFIEGQFTGAIPISRRFSFITDLSLGTECLQNIQRMPNLYTTFGFNLGSRLFFPQFPGDFEYAPHRMQGMLAVQFEPWDDITIFGGKIFFTYFVGAGNLWTSYEDVFTGFFNGMQWNTGLQLGVNIKKAFNFFLRGGVGSYGNKVVPFISFDVGTLRL